MRRRSECDGWGSAGLIRSGLGHPGGFVQRKSACIASVRVLQVFYSSRASGSDFMQSGRGTSPVTPRQPDRIQYRCQLSPGNGEHEIRWSKRPHTRWHCRISRTSFLTRAASTDKQDPATIGDDDGVFLYGRPDRLRTALQ